MLSGARTADVQTASIVHRILAQYNLTPQVILEPQKGYRNTSYPVRLVDGSMANVIIYKNEPGIAQRITHANHIGDSLWHHGFPARHTYDSRVVRLRTPTGDRYASVYAYLPGRTIPWEAYTAKHIKLLGKTMSDMHALLADADVPNLPHVVDEYDAILHRMQRYFADEQVTVAMQHKLQLAVDPGRLRWLRMVLRICRQLPSQQPLHMDFVRGNVLFDGDDGSPVLTGVLDFEKVMYGHLLCDMARTLAFLLVDCSRKTPAQVYKYFLISGYQRRGRAHFTNIAVTMNGKRVDLLEELITLFLLHDFYKFLRHNPYESLAQNHHYRQTYARLCDRNVFM